MKRVYLAASLLAASAALALPTASGATEPASSRQQEIARKGADVMPFDLRRTTHFFDDAPTGGVESVTANDRKDGKQISLIRAHLQEEQARFSTGDFSDPAQIHGAHMPGLASLAAAGPKLKVTYRAVPGGASLTYESRDPQIVQAIHEWFAAQRTDHAAHEHMHHD